MKYANNRSNKSNNKNKQQKDYALKMFCECNDVASSSRDNKLYLNSRLLISDIYNR